jgi:hypothetical protein
MLGATPQLLVIIVLPVIAGLIFLLIASLFHRPNSASQFHPATLDNASERPFTVLSIADAFDPERAVLWSFQLPALQFISSRAPLSAFWRFCERYPEIYPELFAESSLSAWFQFLRKCGLVEVVGVEVRLTPQGREFVALLERSSEPSRLR